MGINQKTSGLGRSTILVIDDDEAITRAISMRLTNTDCSCVMAHGGAEALGTYAITDIDLVITDMDMPGVDGLGVVGMIRNQSDVPIIVVTGFAEKYGDLLAPFPNVSVLPKPFDTYELIELASNQLAA